MTINFSEVWPRQILDLGKQFNLMDVLKTPWRYLCKTSCRRLQNVLKTSARQLWLLKCCKNEIYIQQNIFTFNKKYLISTKTFTFNKIYLHSMKICLYLIILNFHAGLYFSWKKWNVQWNFFIQWFSVVKSGLSFISEIAYVSWLVCILTSTQTHVPISSLRLHSTSDSFAVRFSGLQSGLSKRSCAYSLFLQLRALYWPISLHLIEET